MRHRKKKKISLTKATRQALVRKMSIALLEKGKIRTTAPRARLVRQFIEPLVTKAKRGTLESRRQIIAALGSASAMRLLLQRAEQYRERPGGYTRITRLAKCRDGDRAQLVQLEFV